jgi:hypothetical protein
MRDPFAGNDPSPKQRSLSGEAYLPVTSRITRRQFSPGIFFKSRFLQVSAKASLMEQCFMLRDRMINSEDRRPR